MNFDGSVIATETYAYGTTPEYKGETPVYGAYTFTGWSPAVADNIIQSFCFAIFRND